MKVNTLPYTYTVAVRPPEINGSDIRSQEHSLYTVINGGPQTALHYIYVRYYSWFRCGSQWHGQQVQNPKIRQSGNLLQLLAMLLTSQKGSIKLPFVRRTESSPKEPATNFGILYVRGNLNSWGPQHLGVCSGLIYATGGDNIASENTWYLPRMNGRGLEKGIMASRHRTEYMAKYNSHGFPSNASFKLYGFSLSNRHDSTHV